MGELSSIHEVENKIINLRGQQVILDCDVAELYGIKTKEVNQAVKNNPEKFPTGYVLIIDNKDITILRSKILTAKFKSKSRVSPKAFTEKGLYMLATILKSPQAVKTTIAIVETFAKLRELAKTVESITRASNNDEQQQLASKSGELLDEIIQQTSTKQTIETSFEINIAMLKIKHSIKKEKNSSD